MIKLIIAGTRTFKDFTLLKNKLDILLNNHTERITIISGGAPGADTLGEQYAKLRGYNIRRFVPNWKQHGKSAGYKRNRAMAEKATHAVVFWDGASKGSGHMIDIARELGINLRVVMVKPTPKKKPQKGIIYAQKPKKTYISPSVIKQSHTIIVR